MLRHIVTEDQTTAMLAERYGVTAEELAALNGFAPTEQVHAGLLIFVPGGEAGGHEAHDHDHDHRHDHDGDSHRDRHHRDYHRKSAVLHLPGELFAALKELEEDDGFVRLRILRVREGGSLRLEIT